MSLRLRLERLEKAAKEQTSGIVFRIVPNGEQAPDHGPEYEDGKVVIYCSETDLNL